MTKFLGAYFSGSSGQAGKDSIESAVLSEAHAVLSHFSSLLLNAKQRAKIVNLVLIPKLQHRTTGIPVSEDCFDKLAVLVKRYLLKALDIPSIAVTDKLLYNPPKWHGLGVRSIAVGCRAMCLRTSFRLDHGIGTPGAVSVWKNARARHLAQISPTPPPLQSYIRCIRKSGLYSDLSPANSVNRDHFVCGPPTGLTAVVSSPGWFCYAATWPHRYNWPDLDYVWSQTIAELTKDYPVLAAQLSSFHADHPQGDLWATDGSLKVLADSPNKPSLPYTQHANPAGVGAVSATTGLVYTQRLHGPQSVPRAEMTGLIFALSHSPAQPKIVLVDCAAVVNVYQKVQSMSVKDILLPVTVAQ